MKANSKFDYIIVGGGLSGLHLSNCFSDDTFFSKYSFLIIDKQKRDKKDNYFSYWEKGTGKWDSILSNKWNKALMFSSKRKVEMDFSDYSYKTLSSLKFRDYVKKKLKKKKNFKFISDTVLNIREEKNKVIVVGNKKNYIAKHIFDSRFSNNTLKKSKSHTFLKQHFLGWVIKTNEKKFDKKSFIFMDYRVRDKNSTAFTYVLPFKKNEALIEHTYFSKDPCNKELYEDYLKKYLKRFYKNMEYKIIKSEMGIIPMTTYPFHKDSTKNITKIGTAGGWVKASTGYSFKNCEKYSIKILENIKAKKDLKIVPDKKYFFLDKILLGVLYKYNYRGEIIFEKLIKRNSTKKILRFLDEESSLFDILKIIISMRSFYFVSVFIRNLFKKDL